jgi:DNA-directed RNA polymerase
MQPSIVEQLELEKRMVVRGAQRYHEAKDRAVEAGRAPDMPFAKRLIASHLPAIAEGIREYTEAKGPGTGAKLRKHVAGVSAEQAAYFVLRAVFTKCFGDKATVTEVGAHIGRYVEDEIRFSKFQEKHSKYYQEIIEDFKRKGTVEYRHKHRVLTKKATDMADKWKPWKVEERILVGVKLLDILEQRTQLIVRISSPGKRGKSGAYYVQPSPEVVQWLQQYDDYAEFLAPERMPCVISPEPWSSPTSGGYFSPDLRMRTPMVLNIRSKKAKQYLEQAEMPMMLNMLNEMQATTYSVNKPVLEVLQTCWEKNIPIGMPPSEPYAIPECPMEEGLKKADMTEAQLDEFNNWKREAAMLYTAERDRVSKSFQIATVLRTAKEYSRYDKFWFVHQLDFRGRAYSATSGFSPQGPDLAKASLLLSEGKRLGSVGMSGLRVHGANTYGYDKATLADREEWVRERERDIIACADRPLDHRDFWANADKPWQFLAFCFEYRDARKAGSDYASRLVYSTDGSCNGLQHFSALLRDSVGGAATNLSPAMVPRDIYSDVARKVLERIRASDDPMAREWLAVADAKWNGAIPRKLAKTPVMTLPYGSTQRTCTDSIFAFLYNEDRKLFDSNFKAALFLTPILWDAISDTVVKARQAMDWLQDAAGLLAHEGFPLHWVTPLGFPVYQANHQIVTRKISTQLCGRVQLKVGSFSDRMDRRRMENGASPNFVHSMDACHQAMTIHRARQAGVSAFSMVHDSYGCHAADWATMNRALRESFVDMYENANPLETLRDFVTTYSGITLPKLPDVGDLDLRGVLDSPYFFA